MKNQVPETSYKTMRSVAQVFDFLPCQKKLELSEHLKKYLGTRHELNGGFTWLSFIEQKTS
ncbi:hypothetical protein Ahy_B09g098116 isoform E [Arachis hypogaea]|uniref:Uncharacterized protein n=1 Tax=Arachis hypogaea TaxID=3818 RepID=A0A444XQM3_ARAHY|nr:hypothetical protein Ahy_B09g098116 isoform E [Arachis hypogaea]